MKIVRFSFMAVAALMLLASCGNKAGRSSTTGWDYNNPEWGGFEVSGEGEQGTAPGLVFIEGGSFVMGHVTEDTRYKWDNVAHTVTVSSFYIDECEVNNRQYRPGVRASWSTTSRVRPMTSIPSWASAGSRPPSSAPGVPTV